VFRLPVILLLLLVLSYRILHLSAQFRQLKYDRVFHECRHCAQRLVVVLPCLVERLGRKRLVTFALVLTPHLEGTLGRRDEHLQHWSVRSAALGGRSRQVLRQCARRAVEAMSVCLTQHGGGSARCLRTAIQQRRSVLRLTLKRRPVQRGPAVRIHCVHPVVTCG